MNNRKNTKTSKPKINAEAAYENAPPLTNPEYEPSQKGGFCKP